MGVFDWLTQGLSKAGDWLHQNIGKPLGNAVEWVNQKIIQPGAAVAKYIPGFGTIADLTGRAGNAATNVIQGAIGDKRKIDLGDALGTGTDIYKAIKTK